jgi:uncharacterized membrane protein
LPNTRNEHTIKGATRIETFSDGVFAIAITLLVLDLISVLHSDNSIGLVQTCLDHWQSFLAFAIGFVTILVCWINHHVAFESIKNVDTNLMWINGLLLFVVTLTPFPTAVLAEYLLKESTTAFAVFGFNYILISIAAYSICAYAYHHQLIKEEDRDHYYGYKLIYGYAILYNIVAFVLCFFSFVLPIILYTALFIVFAAPKQFAQKVNRRRLSGKNKRTLRKRPVGKA